MDKEVIVIGTVYVDIKGYPIGKYVPTGRNVGRVEHFHGGVGRNIAEDIANLGEKVAMIGLVNDSGIGSDVITHLQEQGVNTIGLRATENGMGTWLAIFDEHGEISANISVRPNLLPIVDVLNDCGDELFAKASGILLEIDIEEPIVEKTFALAEKYGVDVYSVISNINIAMERFNYIQKCKCFVCNRQEAGVFFDSELADKTPQEMLDLLKQKIEEKKLNSMIVTMDADGAVYASHQGEEGMCPAEKVEVVDTTGAGDSFFAGSATAMSHGKSMAEACALGAKMAARVISYQDNVYKKEDN